MANGKRPNPFGFLDEKIAEAAGRVVDKGMEEADLKDILLVGFGWMAWQVRNRSNSHRRDVIIRVGTPAVGGASLGGIVWLVLEKLLGG